MHRNHLEMLCTAHRNSGIYLCMFCIEGFSLSNFYISNTITWVDNVLKQKRLISVRLLEVGHLKIL